MNQAFVFFRFICDESPLSLSIAFTFLFPSLRRPEDFPGLIDRARAWRLWRCLHPSLRPYTLNRRLRKNLRRVDDDARFSLRCVRPERLNGCDRISYGGRV